MVVSQWNVSALDYVIINKIVDRLKLKSWWHTHTERGRTRFLYEYACYKIFYRRCWRTKNRVKSQEISTRIEWFLQNTSPIKWKSKQYKFVFENLVSIFHDDNHYSKKSKTLGENSQLLFLFVHNGSTNTQKKSSWDILESKRK